jgi:hypothetical protein
MFVIARVQQAGIKRAALHSGKVKSQSNYIKWGCSMQDILKEAYTVIGESVAEDRKTVACLIFTTMLAFCELSMALVNKNKRPEVADDFAETFRGQLQDEGYKVKASTYEISNIFAELYLKDYRKKSYNMSDEEVYAEVEGYFDEYIWQKCVF